MFKRLAVGLGAAAVLLSAGLALGPPAHAQGISQKVGVCDPKTAANCLKPNANGSINVSGTISASLGAFNPVGTTTLAVTTTSARVAFPTADPTAVIRNTGTADAYLVFGTNTVVATTGTGTLLPAGQAVAYNVGTATNVAAITASGSTNLSITTGTGLPALTGGGGGSGGGGAVTAAASSYADGYATTMGALADAACGTDNGSCSSQALLKRQNQRITSMITALGSPVQAVAQGSTTSGQTGGLILGAVTTASPTYTTAQTSPLSLDTTGALRVNVTAGGAGGGAITAASGSYAAGAFAAGSGVDGWNLTEGAKADTAYAGSGSASMVAILKGIYSSVNGPIPAGTAIIGASYAYQNSSGNTLPPAADSSAAINVSTATTTQLVALSSGKKIYVSSFDVVAGGTGNITFVYGTGSNCGTGTTSLTGAYNLTAQNGIAKGNGLGAVLVVPASNALCVTTSAAVQMSGSVAYSQF